MLDYSEKIEVYYIKVGMYSKLNEYIEIYMYQRSRSFFDICPRSLRMKLDLRWAIEDHFSSGFSYLSYVSFWSYAPFKNEMEILLARYLKDYLS